MQQIADHLDLTPEGARKFCGAAGIVWRQQSLDSIRIAYVRRLREQAAGRSSADGDLDLVEERAALARAQREKIELELAEARGELVRVQDVLDTWAGHIGAAKQALLGLPAKAAGQIAPPGKTAEAEAILRRLVKELLTELSESGQPRNRQKAARRSGADVEAAAGPDC